MKSQSILYFVLAILFSFATFLFFGVFFREGVPIFAVNVSAAILGSLITVFITMLLLNKQSEAEMLKERNAKILDEKINVYNELIKQVKDILTKGNVDTKDIIEIQLLNQKLSFIAGETVIERFNDFAKEYIKAAKNEEINDDERNLLIETIGELSIEIRKDLASEEELKNFKRDKVKKLIDNNIKILKVTKITKDEFLKDYAVYTDYCTKLFKFLDENEIEYNMGTVGFSILKKINCIPKGNREGIQFLINKLSQEEVNYLKDVLPKEINFPNKTIVKINQLSIGKFTEIILKLAKK